MFNNELWLTAGIGAKVYDDIWKSADGAVWTKVAADTHFSARYNTQLVSFNNELWLTGGVTQGGDHLNDAWHSADGINWTQAPDTALFDNRMGHQTVEFDGKLWIIGGFRTINYFYRVFHRDVWSSADGTSWTREVEQLPFDGRLYHQVVVFGDQLLLTGGYTEYDRATQDVWASENGVD